MYNKNVLYGVIAALITFYGCYGSDISSGDWKIIKDSVTKKLSIWEKYSIERNTDFHLEDFYVSTIPIKFSYQFERELSEDFLKRENNFFIYSPDSSKILDIYSYSVIIDSAKEEIKVGFEVDSEGRLIDIQAKKSFRIHFLGSIATMDDAAWIDNSNFIIVGFTEAENLDYYKPVIWYFNLDRMEKTTYMNNSLYKRSDLTYIQSKFSY